MKCGICKKNIASSEEYGHVSLDYDSHTLSRNGTQVVLCMDCEDVVFGLTNSVRERGGSEKDVFDTLMVLNPVAYSHEEVLWRIFVHLQDGAKVDIPVLEVRDPDYLPYLKACADKAGAINCVVLDDGSVEYRYEDRLESKIYARKEKLDGQ